MINKKICMLGSLSVGKTSLVEQYVNSIFSDKYLSTVGVKISKKVIDIDETNTSLVLWDMEGKDEYTDINMQYLRGSMGFFVVADQTRLDTFDAAIKLRQIALGMLGRDVPNMLLLNKSDLPNSEVDNDRVEKAISSGIKILRTSAKTRASVDEAFETLARNMLT
jgi:small GTP-binding protein